MRDSEQEWVKDQIQDKLTWHYTLSHRAIPFWLIDCPVCKHPTMGTYGNKDGMGCTICLTCGGSLTSGLIEIKPSKKIT